MKSANKPSMLTRWRKLGVIIIWMLVLYGIVGFLVLPPIVRNQMETRLGDLLERSVTVKQVRLNPFTLSATIRGLRIQDKNGLAFVAWDEMHVDLQSRSLLEKVLVLRELRLVNPYIRVQVNKDKSLNFSDLIEKFSKTGKSSSQQTNSAPIAIRIGRLNIIGAAAGYTDFTPRRPFTRRIGPLDLSLDNFRTDPDNENRYSFAGTTDAGEQFSWSGYFFLNPIRSRGQLRFENLALAKYSPLYQDFSRFEVRDGIIGLSSDYEIELSDANRVMSVSNLSFNLQSLKVGAQGQLANMFELSRFNVHGASIDAVKRTAEVQGIAGYGGRLTLVRDRNAAINVVELSRPPADAGGVPAGILMLLQSVTNTFAALLASTNQWSATAYHIDFWDNSLYLEDAVNSRPARLTLDRMEFSATNLSNVAGNNLTAVSGLRWNTNGTLRVEAYASFQPPAVDLKLALNGIDLHPLDPYLESKLNVIILNSKLGVDGNIHLRTPATGLPQVNFTGDAWLEDLAAIDGVLGADLLSWKAFRLLGISAYLDPAEIRIRQVLLDHAVTKVAVETNRTVNLLAALNMDGGNAKTDLLPPVVMVGPGASNAPPAILPKVFISNIALSNVQAQFIDRSIQPVARFTLDDLSGGIANLSSEDTQSADLDLRARLLGVGELSIVGTVTPLAENQNTDLKLSLKNLDLTPVSPYAGKFAGYRIARGKLGLNFNCRIIDRKLQASNLIELDQFAFGEKVVSTNATKLPVKLAVAILKDRDGKILLDVPIEDSLDNPEFHFGKVISRAILNVIVKIATSPFSVLGALFGGGGEEMGWQEFAPGSSLLATNETAKLDKLVKALYARPALQVSIEGAVDGISDLDALRRNKLSDQLRQLKWQSLRKTTKATTRPEDVEVAPDERFELVKKLYRKILTRSVIIPTNSISGRGGSGMAGKSMPAFRSAEMDKAAVKQMRSKDARLLSAAFAVTPVTGEAVVQNIDPAVVVENAVLQTIDVNDEDFAFLAAARARQVQKYLLEVGKVEPERVFMKDRGDAGARLDGARTWLQLQ